MSGTEAAASLFDSADSTFSDPFATLGTEHNQESSGSLFNGPTADHSAQSDAANLFDNLAEQQLSPNTSAEMNPNQAAAQGYGYTQDPYTPVHASEPSEVYKGHQTHQQWGGNQSYFDPSVQSNTSYEANRYVLSATHDPYPASQVQTHTPSASYLTTSHSANQTSAYDTRKADLYVPPQPLDQYAHSPYDNYASTLGVKSVTTAHQPHYAIPQAPPYSSLPPPPRANLATVPPPPAPATTQVTRPKVLNAYDPPFPVNSYSRRNVSGSAKYGVPPPAQSAYAAHHPTTPPPLPPPPRAPSVHSVSNPLSSPPSTHVLPATQPPPPTWTNGSSTSHAGSPSYASYGTSSPPSSFSTSAEPRSHWAHPQQSQDHHGTRHAIAESLPSEVEGLQESESEIFDGIGRQDGHTEPNLALEQPFEMFQPSASTDSTVANSLIKSAQPQFPSSCVTSSPQKSLKGLSPPPHRMSQDSGRVSSPRLSSPVYRLSEPSRASPDPRKEFVRSEDIPRAKTTSPGADGPSSVVNPYAPPPGGPTLRSKSTSMASSDGVTRPEPFPQDRYAPRSTRISNVYGTERSGSPGSLSVRSSDGWQSAKAHLSYLPRAAGASYTVAPLATEPVHTLPEEDLYVPSQHASAVKPSQSHGGYGQSPYSYSADLSPPDGVAIKPTIAPYAPSPSLLGANDPLGRTSVRVPVISFGFGGRLITCFHNTGSLSTGFDVALSSRASAKVQLQNWKSLVPESALDSATGFPGPLQGDPGPPSTSIMKATATVQAKLKKTQLLKYLSDRVDEITQGLGYLHNGSIEKRMTEGKLVLVKLLRIMVENDGRLFGTPEIDTAVRAALVPRLEGSLSTNESGGTFTTTADTAVSYGTSASAGDGAPISVTTLRVAALDKIEEFLLRGDRRQAYHYALDEKLWAHAMIIASSIDKEAWKEVVNEFIRADLGVKGDSTFALPGRTDAHAPSVNGREGLRVAYSLFSGQGAGAVQEMIPKNILTRANGRLPLPAPAIPAPALGQETPRTPNFALPTAGAKISAESLSRWAETVAMMIMSPITPDASAALTALGDQLMTNGWLEAAHVCYLLSPQTSPVGGIGNPAVRVVLLGGKSPTALPTFSRDPDSILFTETLEYALASAPVPKGQEPNHGIPHLQAYRLIRAYAAAEAGDLGIASRYCEAITASLVRGSVYFTPTMLEQLKGLADRLSGVSHSDKNNSWMAGKISKPSLDTIGGWLEGRFTKLVTGESDSPASPKEDNGGKVDGVHGFTGPFAHYNTISSRTSSARSSPAPTFVAPAYVMPSAAAPPRTGSAMSNKVPSHGHGHVYGMDRSSIGMEASIRRKQSPAPGSLQTTTSYSIIQTKLGNPQSNRYNTGSDLQTPKQTQHQETGGDEVGDGNAQEVTWWGSSYSGDQGKTPTGARFEKVDEMQGSMDNNGFFSPMMNESFTIGPQSSTSSTIAPSRQASAYEDIDEDELGLGNSSRRVKKGSGGSEGVVGGEAGSEQGAKLAAASAVPAQGAEKKADSSTQQSSGGWLSRWWGRKENTSGGPVKASLGEESSFYYDKELKRWVNKKGGAEATKATPSPPPPRAQTASPGMMAGPKPSAGAPGPPPPASNANGNTRPASAIDLTTLPPTSKQPSPSMRVRSGLAPPGLDSAPPTPTETRIAPHGNGGGPPPSRPKSQASQKRSVRSRYVDVFAQEGANDSGA